MYPCFVPTQISKHTATNRRRLKSNFYTKPIWKVDDIVHRPVLIQFSPNNIVVFSGIGDDVLSTTDVISGTIFAFILAYSWSFLQRNNSNDVILWKKEESSSTVSNRTNESFGKELSDNKSFPQSQQFNGNNNMSAVFEDKEQGKQDRIVFDADSWKDMSRPENYVWYNTKVRQNMKTMKDGSRAGIMRKETNPSSGKLEKRWVLIGLIVLFLPIFTAEFFFALSRQFLCSDVFSQTLDASWMCSPVIS